MHNGSDGKLIKVTTLPNTEIPIETLRTSWTNTVILTVNLCFWQLYFKLFEMLLPARRKMQHFTLTAEVELGLFVLNVQFEYGTKFNPSKYKHIALLNILKSRTSPDATMGCCCWCLAFIFKNNLNQMHFWKSPHFPFKRSPFTAWGSQYWTSLRPAASENLRTKLQRALQKIRHCCIFSSWI